MYKTVSNKFVTSVGVFGGALALSATALQAGELTLEVEIPQQNVAEYHRPYVAGWVEDATGAHISNVFVWYDVKKREGAGQKWLKDMRTWWRKSGRDLTLPVDGVTSATKAPGRQTLELNPIALKLKPGTYVMVIEAAREAGGHDLVKLPFPYAPTKGVAISTKGEGEIGKVKLIYKP